MTLDGTDLRILGLVQDDASQSLARSRSRCIFRPTPAGAAFDSWRRAESLSNAWRC